MRGKYLNTREYSRIAGDHYNIQRYSTGVWTEVCGQFPFIVAGPSFKSLVLRDYPKYTFREPLAQIVDTRFPEGSANFVELRKLVAEWAFREGWVQAMWSVKGGACPEPPWRWECAVLYLASEMCKSDPPGAALEEYLSGIPSVEHYRELLSKDDLPLEPTLIPA